MSNMRFNFVAKIEANNLDAKVPFLREINTVKTKKVNGKEVSYKVQGYSLNLIAVAEQNNRAFMEMAGFKNNSIKTMDTDNNKIELSWDDRNDPDVMKTVANYKKYVITLNGDRHEFITEFDFIEFVRDNIDEIKGKEYTVTGQVKKNEYNGKISDRFVIQNMFEVTEEKKHQLKVYGEFFWNADGVDTSDWKDEKKIIFNGYTKEYMDKNHPNVYVEKTIIFDASRINFENEGHINLLNYKLKQMGLEYNDGKIKANLKKNTYYCESVVLSYVNGSEKIAFDESQLTENQREAIQLGLKTLDDFRPAGNIYGERVVMLKLVDFDSRDKFADGCIPCDETKKEFEENIYASANSESLDDFEKSMNKPEKEKKNDEVDLEDDLFG